jgi:hypothetical protein
MRRFPSMPIIHRGITLPQRSEHFSILFLMQCTDRQPNAVSMWSTPITGMSLWFSDTPPFYALAFIMEALVLLRHCQQHHANGKGAEDKVGEWSHSGRESGDGRI